MNIDTSPKGWSCPKCARVWAPHIGACAACNDRQMIEAPRRPPPYTSVTCGQVLPEWNFNGDDQSYI